MITGYLRQDDSCHWYAVPKDKIGLFDETVREIETYPEESELWHSAIDYFSDHFSEYRTGGGIGHLEVIIQP